MTKSSHITVILDRTGSMADIRDDVIGGFNSFLAEQKLQPDPATFTLVQFDSQDPFEVVQPVGPIADARPLTHETYVPRASTPLYDAIGRGIVDLETMLGKLPNSERPERIIFVIVTDGQENASREFTRAPILAAIEKKRKAGWQFVFLSADVESFEDAGRMGMADHSRLLFKKSKKGNDAAWASVSDKLARFRDGSAPNVRFDDNDRGNQDAADS
jgi:hypothetical protein